MQQNEYPDLMLDIETLGTRNNAVVLCIGAMKFNFNERTISDDHFYAKIDISSQVREYNRRIEGDTLTWWLSQEVKVYEKIVADLTGRVSVKESLELLQEFIGNKDTRIWGNGSVFDVSKIEDLMIKDEFPKDYLWQYRNIRCARTIASLAPDIRSNMKFEGDPHDPVDDCKHQIKWLLAIADKLNLKQ
jgi:hypothetical protein